MSRKIIDGRAVARGGVQGDRCTPLSSERGCNNEFAPPPPFQSHLPYKRNCFS